VRLDREIDVSRGDLFSSMDSTARVSQEIAADVCWLDPEPALLQHVRLVQPSYSCRIRVITLARRDSFL